MAVASALAENSELVVPNSLVTAEQRNAAQAEPGNSEQVPKAWTARRRDS